MLKLLIAFTCLGASLYASGQKLTFTEYDLPNGLHVILHQDKAAPVVAVSVMYHVGSKDEIPSRTGFAHFFEHLLFEGSKNIPKGEFAKIVSAAGGRHNANTTQDRTFYYEVLPSNQLETGLWLESERMMHPVINEVGVKTQNEVVKEEKRMRVDNQPYGNLLASVMSRLFTKHAYNWVPIGSMEHLDAATLAEFMAFFKKWYAPNNAVLSIAGDIDIAKTKQLVEAYFGPVPKGAPAVKNPGKEDPITKPIADTVYDNNIQIPAVMIAYRTPGLNSKESKILDLASSVLSGGNSSRMYKKMVDDKKNALAVASFNYALEDYGSYIIYAIPNAGSDLDSLIMDMDEEIVKLQQNLISETDFTKIMNQFENDYVAQNNSMLGVAENLASGYSFRNNTNYVNTELTEIRKLTRQDIQAAAKKYLNPNQRVVIYYKPGQAK